MSVAPRLFSIADVDTRLIVSAPAPRSMVPGPRMIWSSCWPLRVTESSPAVPMRLPISTLRTVGIPRAAILPTARTFSVSVPVLRSIDPRPAHSGAVSVTTSLMEASMVMSMTCVVPSAVATVTRSCSESPSTRASTTGLALSRT